MAVRPLPADRHLPRDTRASVLPTVRMWLDLLDYASDKGVTDDHYMALADRMTQWIGSLGLPMAQENQRHEFRRLK